MEKVKISFGIIVLNGMPFVKYCLRQLYPHAHEIIVVEGGVETAKMLTDDAGHSTDGTLKALEEFKREEDVEGKLTIVSQDKHWKDKDEQSQAYANRATGNYLWQVDIDEFYKHRDIKKVISVLSQKPQIDGMSFKMVTFWGGFDYLCDGWYLKLGANIYKRLFKWRNNYTYQTHRPPTVVDAAKQPLSEKHWLTGKAVEQDYQVIMYHYSLVFPNQVRDKSKFYEKKFRPGSNDWFDTCYMHLEQPLRVHNVFNFPSWLERFNGQHPEQICQLIGDIQSGDLTVVLRHTQDIEQLLRNPVYACQRTYLKIRFELGQFNRQLLQRFKTIQA